MTNDDSVGNADLTKDLMCEELDASTSYDRKARASSDPKAKAVYRDIADEEETHLGELAGVLRGQDPNIEGNMREGLEESEHIELSFKDIFSQRRGDVLSKANYGHIEKRKATDRDIRRADSTYDGKRGKNSGLKQKEIEHKNPPLEGKDIPQELQDYFKDSRLLDQSLADVLSNIKAQGRNANPGDAIRPIAAEPPSDNGGIDVAFRDKFNLNEDERRIEDQRIADENAKIDAEVAEILLANGISLDLPVSSKEKTGDITVQGYTEWDDEGNKIGNNAMLNDQSNVVTPEGQAEEKKVDVKPFVRPGLVPKTEPPEETTAEYSWGTGDKPHKFYPNKYTSKKASASFAKGGGDFAADSRRQKMKDAIRSASAHDKIAYKMDQADARMMGKPLRGGLHDIVATHRPFSFEDLVFNPKTFGKEYGTWRHKVYKRPVGKGIARGRDAASLGWRTPNMQVEPIMVDATDAAGNILYDVVPRKVPVLDENGKPMYNEVTEYDADGNGTTHLEQVFETDDEGKPIIRMEKVPKKRQIMRMVLSQEGKKAAAIQEMSPITIDWVWSPDAYNTGSRRMGAYIPLVPNGNEPGTHPARLDDKGRILDTEWDILYSHALDAKTYEDYRRGVPMKQDFTDYAKEVLNRKLLARYAKDYDDAIRSMEVEEGYLPNEEQMYLRAKEEYGEAKSAYDLMFGDLDRARASRGRVKDKFKGIVNEKLDNAYPEKRNNFVEAEKVRNDLEEAERKYKDLVDKITRKKALWIKAKIDAFKETDDYTNLLDGLIGNLYDEAVEEQNADLEMYKKIGTTRRDFENDLEIISQEDLDKEMNDFLGRMGAERVSGGEVTEWDEEAQKNIPKEYINPHYVIRYKWDPRTNEYVSADADDPDALEVKVDESDIERWKEYMLPQKIDENRMWYRISNGEVLNPDEQRNINREDFAISTNLKNKIHSKYPELNVDGLDSDRLFELASEYGLVSGTKRDYIKGYRTRQQLAENRLLRDYKAGDIPGGNGLHTGQMYYGGDAQKITLDNMKRAAEEGDRIAIEMEQIVNVIKGLKKIDSAIGESKPIKNLDNIASKFNNNVLSVNNGRIIYTADRVQSNGWFKDREGTEGRRGQVQYDLTDQYLEVLSRDTGMNGKDILAELTRIEKTNKGNQAALAEYVNSLKARTADMVRDTYMESTGLKDLMEKIDYDELVQNYVTANGDPYDFDALIKQMDQATMFNDPEYDYEGKTYPMLYTGVQTMFDGTRPKTGATLGNTELTNWMRLKAEDLDDQGYGVINGLVTPGSFNLTGKTGKFNEGIIDEVLREYLEDLNTEGSEDRKELQDLISTVVSKKGASSGGMSDDLRFLRTLTDPNVDEDLKLRNLKLLMYPTITGRGENKIKNYRVVDPNAEPGTPPLMDVSKEISDMIVNKMFDWGRTKNSSAHRGRLHTYMEGDFQRQIRTAAAEEYNEIKRKEVLNNVAKRDLGVPSYWSTKFKGAVNELRAKREAKQAINAELDKTADMFIGQYEKAANEGNDIDPYYRLLVDFCGFPENPGEATDGSERENLKKFMSDYRDQLVREYSITRKEGHSGKSILDRFKDPAYISRYLIDKLDKEHGVGVFEDLTPGMRERLADKIRNYRTIVEDARKKYSRDARRKKVDDDLDSAINETFSNSPENNLADILERQARIDRETFESDIENADRLAAARENVKYDGTSAERVHTIPEKTFNWSFKDFADKDAGDTRRNAKDVDEFHDKTGVWISNTEENDAKALAETEDMLEQNRRNREEDYAAVGKDLKTDESKIEATSERDEHKEEPASSFRDIFNEKRTRILKKYHGI